ncbi:alpha-1,2 glucosyltransferas-like protein alg10 [Westerdykella ornata]|uniref:Dol-P-Glc:Glc(2)Man(9)GlcNAc(2)-PP-Dol alpha-1,2-glucosyltransferase n=1 Tax=Westerdykella ornata TaxID=318751 RepID=A0A6A6JQT3_WESOR|nr:alpha-1,2 glucosyltransferas-like protein alg10 [Westerdykella ornata]KAF2278056.1 alpha-1,2 glucosyltransferas-like protein alg10 [Westerdykella ornata]
MSSLRQTWALPIAFLVVTNAAWTWYRLLAEHVPEPYLDEVFHIPQAQRYCKGDYTWDPKITTPPGLYLASKLISIFVGCNIPSLRGLNVTAISVVCVVAYHIRRNLRLQREQSNRHQDDEQSDPYDAHSALNIGLFPPLFFFSALYYTDVLSTLTVLAHYGAFVQRSGAQSRWGPSKQLAFIVLGIIALLFRQTNIFWVAIFPAGLAAVEALKRDGGMETSTPSRRPIEVLKQCWTEGKVYDSSARDAGPQDYILTVLSVILAAMQRPRSLINAILPYLALVVVFVAFVLWNGGVVLGDKSNHIATVHTPQMLYFWPYVFFFSFPLLLPVLLGPVVRLLPDSSLKSWYQENLIREADAATPGLSSAFLFLAFGTAAVHFNTIVHPFIRADNRHYVFYVFRILLRHWAFKYAAVPIYYACAWTVTQRLAMVPTATVETRKQSTDVRSTPKTPIHPSCTASFVLVWLAATSLSVVSAPLVEPRYFIVPWTIWRLHVPRVTPAGRKSRAPLDVTLILETVWYLAVNAITGYLFLYRGFSWPSEPGKVQRFMY